jgi:hypothetical protein
VSFSRHTAAIFANTCDKGAKRLSYWLIRHGKMHGRAQHKRLNLNVGALAQFPGSDATKLRFRPTLV